MSDMETAPTIVNTFMMLQHSRDRIKLHIDTNQDIATIKRDPSSIPPLISSISPSPSRFAMNEDQSEISSIASTPRRGISSVESTPRRNSYTNPRQSFDQTRGSIISMTSSIDEHDMTRTLDRRESTLDVDEVADLHASLSVFHRQTPASQHRREVMLGDLIGLSPQGVVPPPTPSSSNLLNTARAVNTTPSAFAFPPSPANDTTPRTTYEITPRTVSPFRSPPLTRRDSIQSQPLTYRDSLQSPPVTYRDSILSPRSDTSFQSPPLTRRDSTVSNYSVHFVNNNQSPTSARIHHNTLEQPLTSDGYTSQRPPALRLSTASMTSFHFPSPGSMAGDSPMISPHGMSSPTMSDTSSINAPHPSPFHLAVRSPNTQPPSLSLSIPSQTQSPTNLSPVSQTTPLSPASLTSRATRVASIMKAFDKQFLITDPITHVTRYPEWCLPYVQEMKMKLELLLQQIDASQQNQRNMAMAAATMQQQQQQPQQQQPTSPQPQQQSQRSISPQPCARSASPSSTLRYRINFNDDLPFLRDHRSLRHPPQSRAMNKNILKTRSTLTYDNVSQSHKVNKGKRSKPVQQEEEKEMEDTKQQQETPTIIIQQPVQDQHHIQQQQLQQQIMYQQQQQIIQQQQQLQQLTTSLALLNTRLTSSDSEARVSWESQLTSVSDHHRERMLHVIARMKELQEQQDKTKEKMEMMQREIDAKAKQPVVVVQGEQPQQQQQQQQSQQLAAMLADQDTLLRRYRGQHAALESEQAALSAARAQLQQLQQTCEKEQREKKELVEIMKQMKEGQEKEKYELMEKVSSMSARDATSEQDRARLAKYEYELRAMQEANDALQKRLNDETNQLEETRSHMEKMQRTMEELVREQHRREQQRMSDEKRLSATRLRQAAPPPPEPEPEPTSSTSPHKFTSIVDRMLANHFRNKLHDTMRNTMSLHNRAIADKDAMKAAHDAELAAARAEYDKICSTLSEEMKKRADAEEIIDEYLRLKREHETLEHELQQHKNLTQQQQARLQELQEKLNAAPSHEEQMFSKLMIDSFKGDYLRLRDNSRIISLIYSHGDADIIFSDVVEKMNRNNRIQKRVLVVTNRALYFLLHDHRFTVRRRIPIEQIKYCSLSRQSADIAVIHYQEAHDTLIRTPKRVELLYHLLRTFELVTGTELVARYGERLYVGDTPSIQRDVVVPETQKLELGPPHLVQPNMLYAR